MDQFVSLLVVFFGVVLFASVLLVALAQLISRMRPSKGKRQRAPREVVSGKAKRVGCPVRNDFGR
jgi:hypothetical protein